MTLETVQRTIAFWDDLAEVRVDAPFSAGTLEGFRAWAHSEEFPSQGRISFLGGRVFVDTSPEEIQTHNKVKGSLYQGWSAFLTNHDVGEVLVDGALLINEEAGLGTEPDGLLCLWESLEAGRVQYREAAEESERYVEVVGAADIAAEVVSRSSVHKDTVELVELYFRAGVSEYWLIDARKSDIDFRIYGGGATAFEQREPDAEGFMFSTVLQAHFRMTRTRNPVGGWRYRLEFR